MKKIIPFLILLILGVNAVVRADDPPPQPAGPLTLADCYALTLKQSEKIAIQKELITETEGRFLRAFGAVFPQVSFASSDKRQDGSGGSAFTLKNVPERKFEVTQTLFGGFKEAAAMAGARAEKRQRIHEKERVEQLLLLDVSDAFYLLLEQRKDLKTLSATRRALIERMNELKERERLGRSRPSEVASTKARLRRIEAEQERVRNQETIARQLLEFLTGRTPIRDIADEEVAPVLSPEEMYLTKASQRLDVQAAEEAWRVTQKQVTIAKAPYWPSVSVEGNYYTERAGAAAGVDWDATFKVDVPIFKGSQVYGAVKEASAKAKEAELHFSQTKRTASLEIRDAYVTLQSTITRRATLEKALAADEENYRLQAQDYRLNLVSNLDVLDALEDFEEARRDFIHASYEAKRFYWHLRVAVGETL